MEDECKMLGRTIMVTGGAGFMGSNYVIYLLNHINNYRIIVFDKLTYAGNMENLNSVRNHPRFLFVHGDICMMEIVCKTIQDYSIDSIINFAAETHVDRSINEPTCFLQTNFIGVGVLLECTRKFKLKRFHQISTDEVYGEILDDRESYESDTLHPSNPYAATKASGDLLVLSYYTTYGTPVSISRACNNIGPYQYPEKVVPLFTTNALENKSLPVYGDGLQKREYLHVDEHCQALDIILHHDVLGQVYNIGTGIPITNLEMTETILKTLKKPLTLIQHVQDRPGHDRGYHMNCDKIKRLGWLSKHTPQESIRKTIEWYMKNEIWWKKIKNGLFQNYYEQQYNLRESIKE